MLLLPLLQAVAAPVRAETLLVRPVAVPAPWYEVATGVFAIAALLLLLGIVVLLAGAARAMKGTESSLVRKLDTLGGELVPLLRRLHEVTGDLQEITRSVRGDLQRLSGTASAVDGTVRDVLAVTEARVARVAAMVDEVTDEAETQVAAARALLGDVRRGAASMARSFGARTNRDDAGDARAARGAAPAPPPRRDRATPRRAPVIVPTPDVADDDDEWVAEPMAPSAALRARRRASIAAPATAPREDASWEQEADALIDEAERALGRHFAADGAATAVQRAERDDDVESDPDDPAVRDRTTRPAAAPSGDPWRTGGPRLRPRQPGA